ncbi:MAG: RidA family protein [Fervidobacterium sp.]|uniref:Rid family detoxifying hydrolase n=1 Tax=Fervidobacterium sp. TaxID=1871331 RepID=UPI0025B9A6E6|nr:Rid family detoxifying hydrolase [Fervidobacterium sp.]NPU88437.1 RidA family protein [Fervidobacterium sp.]
MEVLKFEKGPKAVGPYSSAVKVGNVIFFSGILPINTETGELVNDSVENATEQILKNLSTMLSEIGLSLKNVVKTTIFTVKLEEFSKINEVYQKYFENFTKDFPARSTVGAASLPKGALVEMEFIVEV